VGGKWGKGGASWSGHVFTCPLCIFLINKYIMVVSDLARGK